MQLIQNTLNCTRSRPICGICFNFGRFFRCCARCVLVFCRCYRVEGLRIISILASVTNERDLEPEQSLDFFCCSDGAGACTCISRLQVA